MLIGQTDFRISLLRSSLLPILQHGYLGEGGRTETGKYEQKYCQILVIPFPLGTRIFIHTYSFG